MNERRGRMANVRVLLLLKTEPEARLRRHNETAKWQFFLRDIFKRVIITDTRLATAHRPARGTCIARIARIGPHNHDSASPSRACWFGRRSPSRCQQGV